MQLLTARRPHANRHDGATHSGFNSSCLVLFLALIDLSGMGHVRWAGALAYRITKHPLAGSAIPASR